MAISLYGNGIIEEFKPVELVFTDQEILNIFDDCNVIRTKRLKEIPNTWIIWGEREEIQDDQYSNIGSNVVEEAIYTIVIFIHDSELDPSWMLTDNVIYNDYNLFKDELMGYIDHVAHLTVQQQQEKRIADGTVNDVVFLNTTGSTLDKKILFEFNLQQQNENFYKEVNFQNFISKVIEYLKDKYTWNTGMFHIYEDSKMIMYAKDENIEDILMKILKFLESKENYEDMAVITNALEKWRKDVKEKKSDQ